MCHTFYSTSFHPFGVSETKDPGDEVDNSLIHQNMASSSVRKFIISSVSLSFMVSPLHIVQKDISMQLTYLVFSSFREETS